MLDTCNGRRELAATSRFERRLHARTPEILRRLISEAGRPGQAGSKEHVGKAAYGGGVVAICG